MIERRTVRYRIRTTKDKYHQMYGLAGACRFVWNHFITDLQKQYKETGKCGFEYFTLGKRFTELRNAEETSWLQGYSTNIVRHSLQGIQTQYQKFFKDPVNQGLPSFKSKWHSPISFPLLIGQTAKLNGSYLHIARIGYVKLIGNNHYFKATPKSGTVKEENGKWYAYIVHEVEIPDRVADLLHVGIDRNVGQVACSDGQIYRMPDVSDKEAKRRRYQRMMARRQGPDRKKDIQPSNRYVIARRKHRKVCREIKAIRTNWLHQTTRKIANKYMHVVLEDLNTKGMTKSAKGTKENPGKNVAQKKGLNKAILGSNWYKFEQLLNYKAASVIKVAPHYTSQKCYKCGHTDKENRKTQAAFLCVKCGHSDNADINAANNILASGIGASGRGGGDISRPKKRQKERSLSGLKPLAAIAT